MGHAYYITGGVISRATCHNCSVLITGNCHYDTPIRYIHVLIKLSSRPVITNGHQSKLSFI